MDKEIKVVCPSCGDYYSHNPNIKICPHCGGELISIEEKCKPKSDIW